MASQITLTNGPSKAVILPMVGGSISYLTLSSGAHQRNLLALHEGYLFENSWLFPFPNRLKNGLFEFEGKQYQFPLNDQDNKPNALHGFTNDKTFKVDKLTESDCELSYEYKGELSYYPFSCKIILSYELSASELKCEVSIVNTGQSKMPFGFGWHPYFVAEEGLEQFSLKLPGSTIIEFSETGIPTGKEKPSHCFEEFAGLENRHLDNCFRVSNPSNQILSELKFNENESLQLWQSEAFPFIQVYTHPTRKSIAIEPMSCGVNALNTGDGLTVLSPNQIKSFQCGLRFLAH
jgi:aldose 1-epimerase